MIDMLLWIAVGMVIGWHFPQPLWVAVIIEKLRAKINKKLTEKS